MTVWERRAFSERRTKRSRWREKEGQEGGGGEGGRGRGAEAEERGWFLLDWDMAKVESAMKKDLAVATTPRAALERC
jgi:hypothetical protein